jgi:hypothetical protein
MNDRKMSLNDRKMSLNDRKMTLSHQQKSLHDRKKILMQLMIRLRNPKMSSLYPEKLLIKNNLYIWMRTLKFRNAFCS